ncbi:MULTISPECIES: pitrilysin family protein [unclassified Caulobacter]|uniref:M16 family metallopeptidase n=1 Tax=unclassified Caulobacter TaxID=2648921 RepID=UPI000783CEFE|nr:MULTISPECIES: pitrilysin family protein [unclassified Caulobacter]AZS20562.1 insulinase family protein [Caulobacter sp. FWC26]
MTMKKLFASAAIAALVAASPALAATPAKAAPPKAAAKVTGAMATALPTIDIPHTTFKLSNGLTVIVHEDHKAPIVAVNIWYHVGSKNEPVGKTGFAHLFEHLMFNGSEHFNDDWFKALEKLGATDMNGTTNEDRTNYFQNVPTAALDQVLWLESDRMGWLVNAIDKAKLDEQRGVVQNEKRQGENQPYGQVWDIITESTYPKDHPYGHSVIGSMADLDAASLDDVKTWFKNYYGPANATLVLAGDITVAEAKAKAEKYFGDIPSGPPVTRQKEWIAKRTGSQRAEMQDRVPQTRIYKVWNTPGFGAADTDYLDLLGEVLVSDKTSRLYKRLVFTDQTATAVSAGVSPSEIGGQFLVTLTVKPGGDPAAVEKAFDEEFQRLLRDGPTPEEVAKVRTNNLANVVRGAERIGGFGGKSDILAQNQVYLGDAGAYKRSLDRVRAAKASDLVAAGRKWLSDGDFTLTVSPFPNYKAATVGADRKAMPEVGAQKPPSFVKLHRGVLSNGLKVVLAERHETPQVQLSLLFDAGQAAETSGKAGVSSLAVGMMTEGTTNRDNLTLSRELAQLGASVRTSNGLDTSTVSLNTLTTTLDPALALYADILRNPAYTPDDLTRRKRLSIAGIQQAKQNPNAMASRILPVLAYGPSSPYGVLSTEASVGSITRDDLIAYQKAWLQPKDATLIIVGDTTLEQIMPKLEAQLGGWTGAQARAKPSVTAAPSKAAVYLIDKPGAQQSMLMVGNLVAPRDPSDEAAIDVMNTLFGGDFVSRLNMNLREDKHWSYGARSLVTGARGTRLFMALAPVQTDKTAESFAEARKELLGIIGDKPITAAELAKAQNSLTLSLPGSWETAAGVGGSISELVNFNLPDSYPENYSNYVRSVTLDAATAAAKKVIKPEELIWVVVGDRAAVEPKLKAMGVEPRIIDADGNPAK